MSDSAPDPVTGTESGTVAGGGTPASIDVVIAAYNASSTIARAIRSVLAEAEVARVIVVDDASIDDTADTARRIGDVDSRVVVERLVANAGPSGARNRALQIATANWITVLDADDFVLPGRFAKMLAFAGDADLVADDLLVVTEGSDAAPAPMFDPPVTMPRALDATAFIAGNIGHNRKARRDLGFIKPLVRRAVLDRFSEGFHPALRLGEDYELYTRLLLQGARGTLVPPCGYVYSISEGSLSGTHTIEALERFRDCDRALMTLSGIDAAQRGWIARHYRSVDARLQWRKLIEAVKDRNIRAATRTFARSPTVTWFLARQLGEQVRLRTQKRLFGGNSDTI